MPITIPTIEQLTDKQWEVQDLPIAGRYLITGGPGSGKTSIAIRRTEYIKSDDPNATVTAFLLTNTLNDFFGDGIRSLNITSNVQVWAKWQRKMLLRHNAWKWEYSDRIPWDSLSERILNLPLNIMYDHLIIDEAQDFSQHDLQVMSLIAENITVFADENQRLYERGIESAEEIKNVLGIDDDDTYHLSENHRNTKQIMKAAASLAPDEIDVDLDEIVRSGQQPRIIINHDAEGEIKYILKVLNANRQKDIGILHLEKSVIQNIYKRLKDTDNGGIELELMKSNTFDFSNTKPKLCTLNSAKGLEFDIVIMPKMNKDNYYNHPVNLKRVYVGMTRAREDLLMSYVGAYPAIYINQIDTETVRRVTNQ
jgi:DNA helicase IV